MKGSSLAAALLAIVMTDAASASAHDIWITTTGNGETTRAVVNYGHPFDRSPPDAEKVLDLAAITAESKVSLIAGLVPATWRGAPVIKSRPFNDNGHLLLATRYDNGYWVKISDKLYRNVNRRLVPDALDSLWSVKFAKTITGPGAPWDKMLGHELELLPLSDPAAVKPGGTLRVKVLFRGKPLLGVKVERGDGVTPMKEEGIPRFATNGDGIATIPINKPGPVLLALDYPVTPSATPELAATDLYNATLWFNVRYRNR